MKTDLANLGLSLRGTTDRRSAQAPMPNASENRQQPAASSFDQIFKQKSEPKVDATYTNTKPVPIDKDINKGVPDRTDDVGKGNTGPTRDEPRMVSKDKKNLDETRSVSKSKESESDSKENKEGDEDSSVANSGVKLDKNENQKGAQKKNQQQQQAMLKFMDSMENEFGIPPTRIVEAMAKLPPESQDAPAIDTAPQVIDQLNLPEDQQDKALAMYVAMLSQVKDAPQPAKTGEMMFVNAKGDLVQPKNLATATEKKAMLNESLDKLSQNFFMNGPQANKAQPTMPLAGQNAYAQMAYEDQAMASANNPPAEFASNEPSFSNDQLKFEQMKADQMSNQQLYGNTRAQGMQAKSLQQQAVQQKALEQMQATDPNSPESQEFLKSLAALGAAAAALNQEIDKNQAQQSGANIANDQQAVGIPQSNLQSNAFGQMQNVGGRSLGGDFSEDASDGFSDSADSKDFFASTGADARAAQGAHHTVNESRTEFKDVMGGQAAGAQAMGANHSENKANIQQIMNQAQYMIRKGGGEANVQMTPEGLGKVHMRVIVNNGKVSLEMSAETKEAKKLIENSIGDLRSSLGQHKLSIDHIKVDVGNQSGDSKYSENQNQQQRQQDLARDMGRDGREQARQFWSEYRDGESRNQFIPSPALKAYNSGAKQLSPLQPNATSTTERRYAGTTKGRSVDLVA